MYLIKFKKAFKNAIKDDREIFYSCLGNLDKIKNTFDYKNWDNQILQQLKEKILKDNDFLEYVIFVLDSNFGIDFSDNLEVEVNLLKDEDDYMKNIFLTLEFIVKNGDNEFSDSFNYFWNIGAK